MKRVAIYARVSSAAQRDARTVAVQLHDLRAYCKAKGWTVIGEYVDDGKSAAAGKLAARDAFARLAADAASGLLDIVAVVDQNRLTRTTDLRERGAIMGVFQASGVLVAISTTGQLLDLATDEGDLMGSFGAYVAAAENRKRRAATMAGSRRRSEEGGKGRGKTPFGLEYDRDARTWSIHPQAGPAVHELFRRVADGDSTGSIARDLDRLGLRTGKWTPTRVRELVYSSVYLGEYVADRGLGIVVPVPPVVDRDLVDEARAALSARKHRPPPRTRHFHLLTGLATCALCKARIRLHATSKMTHFYICADRRYPRPSGPCALPLLPVAMVDRLVWERVGAYLATSEVVERAMADAERAAPDAAAEQKARAELARLDSLIASVWSQAERALVSPEMAEAQVKRLGKARQAATAALADAQAAAVGIRPAMDRALVAESVGLLRRWFADARTTAEQRHEMLSTVASKIVVEPGFVGLDLRLAVESASADVSSRRTRRLHTIEIGHLDVPIRRCA